MTKKLKCVCLLVLAVFLTINTACFSPTSPPTESSLSQEEESTFPQSSSAPSSSQSDTSSVSQGSFSQTSASEQLPVIPQALFDMLGIGATGHMVKQFAGMDTQYPKEMLYEARIQDGGIIRFQYSSQEADGIITGMRISDSSGERTIAPVPDSYPMKDFIFESGVVSLKVDGLILERDFAIFGKILSDETTVSTGDEAFGGGEFLTRKLAFEKISMTLVQYSENLHTDRWFICEISLRDPSYVTSRGLKVGLGVSETLSMFHTGEFKYNIHLTDGRVDSIDLSKSFADDAENEFIETQILFANDVISEIRMEFHAP